MATLVTPTRDVAHTTKTFVTIPLTSRSSNLLTRHLTGRPRPRSRLRRPEDRPTIHHLPWPMSTSPSSPPLQLANPVRLLRPRKPRRHLSTYRELHPLRPVGQRPVRLPRKVHRSRLGLDNRVGSAGGLVPLPVHQLHPGQLVFPHRVVHRLPHVQPRHQAAHLQRRPVPGQPGLC
jgi:hypothetical protein